MLEHFTSDLRYDLVNILPFTAEVEDSNILQHILSEHLYKNKKQCNTDTLGVDTYLTSRPKISCAATPSCKCLSAELHSTLAVQSAFC